MEKKNRRQFVLVHAGCHGAWCWYKVKTHLEASGHCVTAVDLAASGINMTRVEEIQTLKDYSRPLLETMSLLGSDEKVVLVAHSMGGVPAALAADSYPCKIAAIVFLTSSMPDTKNPPAYAFEKLFTSIPQAEFLDTVFGSYGTPDCPLQSILFGPKFLAEKFYQLSPEEYQRWIIRNFPPKEVIEIKDADHMPMFSKPHELCALLQEIADKYA